VPNYLFVDEAMFALQAHSIATTAHDLSGRFTPRVFSHGPAWSLRPGRDETRSNMTRRFLWAIALTADRVAVPGSLSTFEQSPAR
jgi:hypothetical protein